MSTRSAIIARIGNKYHGVYCHSDGYLEGVGATLLKHYTAPAKVAELVALGDLSCLGEVIGEKHDFDWRSKLYEENQNWEKQKKDPRAKYTRAYHRDRGEPFKMTKGMSWEAVAKKIGHDGYIYVLSMGNWFVSEDGQTLQPFSTALASTVKKVS